MAPIVFVKTDPTFMLAHGMVRELRDLDILDPVGYKEVASNNFIHGNDVNDEYIFISWYNFARTAQSVLRLYMLESTGLRGIFSPEFQQPGKARNEAAMNVLQGQEQGQDEQIQMAGQPEQPEQPEQIQLVKRYVSEFDRLYPHYSTEFKLYRINVGDTRSLPSLMYVVDFQQNLLYHIVTTMDVTYKANQDGGKVIEAKPHVAAFKYKIGEIPENVNQELRYYHFMQELIGQDDENQLGNLNLENLNLENENNEEEDADAV